MPHVVAPVRKRGPGSLQSVSVARSNDRAFVRDTMSRLQDAGIKTWLFGGWAEELLGLRSPRDHHDLDLLYPATDFEHVDAFIARDGRLAEITAKRFAHKRASLSEDIMVELLLVQRLRQEHVTLF